jgi:hypothetical protein
MSALEAIRRLHRIRTTLAAGERLLPDDREWLSVGIDDYLDRRYQTLDFALGIVRTPGRCDARTAAAKARRDNLIREMARTFFPGWSVRQQGLEIDSCLRRYHASAWQSGRIASECPSCHRSTPQEFCWLILKARDHCPSAKHIERVLSARNAAIHAPPPDLIEG